MDECQDIAKLPTGGEAEIWLPVINPRTGMFMPGLDTSAATDFRRGKDGPVERFRLADQYDEFNVWDLWWRMTAEQSASILAKLTEPRFVGRRNRLYEAVVSQPAQ